MRYPICVDCRYCYEETLVLKNKEMRNILLCKHDDYVHPVTGKHMPCEIVRDSKVLCKLEGEGFEPILEVPSSPKDGPTVIVGE